MTQETKPRIPVTYFFIDERKNAVRLGGIIRELNNTETGFLQMCPDAVLKDVEIIGFGLVSDVWVVELCGPLDNDRKKLLGEAIMSNGISTTSDPTGKLILAMNHHDLLSFPENKAGTAIQHPHLLYFRSKQ